MLRLVVAVLALAVAAPPATAGPYVIVHMDRNGQLDDLGFRVTSSRYGGSELAWASIVACVKRRFAPFDMAIVTKKPRGQHIRVLVGGLASQLGYDDEKVNGIAPAARVRLDATVHVFSAVGSEEDVDNLCEVAAHEIGHALGLDHEYLCNDAMSYISRSVPWLACGPTSFVDIEARCGEYAVRDCVSGAATQNSYRQLAAVVGLKHPLVPEDPYSDRRRPMDPYAPPPPLIDDDREPIDPYDRPRPATWSLGVERLTLKKLPYDCSGNAVDIAACHVIR